MFRHCVFFRWNPDVSDEALASLSQGFDQLAEIPGVIGLVHGPDAGLRDDNWDHALIVDFQSKADYHGYATDADHVRFIAEVTAPNTSERGGVQFEIPEA